MIYLRICKKCGMQTDFKICPYCRENEMKKKEVKRDEKPK